MSYFLRKKVVEKKYGKTPFGGVKSKLYKLKVDIKPHPYNLENSM